jgi:TRAP-type C4-dicarboxylate transport system permease small subunit
MTRRLSLYFSVLAGIILIIMISLTFADVVGRAFGSPIPGTYDLMTMLGVLLAAFALPRASLKGAHVIVDLFIDRIPDKLKKPLLAIMKILGVILFLIGAFYLYLYGRNLILSNTVTMTLRIPYYPVVFCLAAACLVECLVLVSQIFIRGEGNSE